MAMKLWELVLKFEPDMVVIEHTVKGRNRASQRWLEFCHKDFLDLIVPSIFPFVYLDPSEWRKIVELRLSKDDKKNNKDVKNGKKRRESSGLSI